MKRKQLLLLVFLLPALAIAAQQGKPAGQPAGMDGNAGIPAGSGMAAAAGSALNSSYVLGPADVITVTVWKEPTLSGSLLVRPDGMISLPLVGDVPASGRTPLQLASQLTTLLRKYIQEPNVSVVLTQINSKKIYLLGEVNKKGSVEMTPGMTLLEAVAGGGGLTDFANSRKMYILRVVDGKQQKIPLQYKRALKGDSEANLPLQAGDTIVVP